ncbi:MAG: uncharacterized protein JWM02_689 [Frankiales bacterium]|nr:uncharacterized protein [Frankiales bacterium]
MTHQAADSSCVGRHSPERAAMTILAVLVLAGVAATVQPLTTDGHAAVTSSGPGRWLEATAVAAPLALLLGALEARVAAGLARALGEVRLVALTHGALLAAAAVASLSTSAFGLAALGGQSAAGTAAAAHAFRALPVVLAGALAFRVLAAGWAARGLLRRRWLRVLVAPFTVVAVSTSGLTGLPFVTTASAAGLASGPCPADVPQKVYDVQAINVDIPLNRFGDHDPHGRMYVLSSRLADVRQQEASQKVSIGLRNDPIQPLVIRANQGDCVAVHYTNNADGGSFGLHIDGLAYSIGQSGDAIGRNPASNAAKGETRTYQYYVPIDPALEGAHYLHPGPGFRNEVNHGLFGSLVVEPPGATYLDPNAVDEAHALALESGWEAIVRPIGNKEFRENVQLYHEIGNEKNDPSNQPLTRTGEQVRFIDPHSDAYRPETRAINYRSESFMNRLDAAPEQEAHGYGSYTFGDPATPMPRGYQADPTKFRILHAGTEMFHVFHMHGGGIRWRFNPVADPTYNYADTGLNKHPIELSDSARLDSQAFGPGESYNLEIEGGAGGVQQGAGDFLFHCHIAEHYVAGMWSFWRVYNTRQPDFAPLADRLAPPLPVDSTQLIGQTYGGQKITAASLNAWIRPQLPPQGVRKNANDAAVWNWTTNPHNPQQFLGETEDTASWPDYENKVAGHPTAMAGDSFSGNRPVLMFNPLNGRAAYPMMRPHLGMRPPFSGNGHSGAPYLGEMGGKSIDTSKAADPWAARGDAICPSTTAAGSPTPVRRFNVVAVEGAVKVTPKDTDPTGQVFVLAHDKQAVLGGTKPFQPLALRANVGDCVAVTLTSELTDINNPSHFSQVNMHIHHVQFDTQASDGVITGMSYEQAVRPYKLEDPAIVTDVTKGSTVLHLSSVAKFQVGEWIGVGLGTEGAPVSGTANASVSGTGPEVRAIASIDTGASTVTLSVPLGTDHPAGEYAGVEFEQYRWYPDVNLDNIFWHDHVDGIHSWAHGLVGQLIVEPKGSTYHDPRTGAVADSGTIVDIHASNALAAGAGVRGSFREMALWEMDKGFGATQDSMFNLRAEPLADRGGDPAQRFSSFAHGDPITPLPRAYPGDPVVIRTVQVGANVDTLGIDGHKFFYENRYTGPDGTTEAAPVDTLHYGISERFTVILQGGAGGPRHAPGDYLYFNGIDRRLADGAWGILRVLPGRVTSDATNPDALQPLPGTAIGDAPGLPTVTGGAPPEPAGPGNPCGAGLTSAHTFGVTAMRVRSAATNATRYAYVPSGQVGAVAAGGRPQPLVLHLVQGQCVKVNVTNSTDIPRIGFHVRGLDNDVASAGVDVGWNPESTIPVGASRTYLYQVGSAKGGGGVIADLAGNDSGAGAGTAKMGLYGAYTVAAEGATFSDPDTGRPTDVGATVDVHVPGHKDYRDFSLLLSDDDPQIGASFMPYPSDSEKQASVLVNYRNAPRDDAKGDAFSSAVNGDPATPILRAYAGDPVVVHAFGAPGSEQTHALNLGGEAFSVDAGIKAADELQTRAIGPWESATLGGIGGAGGTMHQPGDYFYGDMRRAFTRAGMWGLQRVLPRPASCPAPGSGLQCLGWAPNLPVVTFTTLPVSQTSPMDQKVAWISSDPDATFACSLATGVDLFLPCRSPLQTGSLPNGTWTIKVRPTNSGGWEGPLAQTSFTVDTSALKAAALSPVRASSVLRVVASDRLSVSWAPGFRDVRGSPVALGESPRRRPRKVFNSSA